MNKLHRFMIISLITVVLIAIVTSIIKLKPFQKEEHFYQYIDFQDEFGIANKCSYEKGVPICIDEKGVVILVKMYADITEEVNNAR